jgi:hypothetical protein
MSNSHSAYDATSTECNRVKIDGFLYPNFMLIPKKVSEKFLHHPPSVLKKRQDFRGIGRTLEELARLQRNRQHQFKLSK